MTDAELAILSLIAEQPRHGYEVEQVIEQRGMRDWTEVGFSSIYYVLQKLARQGLVESRLQLAEGRGPARKMYRITAAGQAAWQAATLAALSEPGRCYLPFQLALANLPGLDEREALAALRQYRAALEARQTYVAARSIAQQPLPAHVEAMFSHSLALIAAEREWMGAFIAQLEQTHAKD